MMRKSCVAVLLSFFAMACAHAVELKRPSDKVTVMMETEVSCSQIMRSLSPTSFVVECDVKGQEKARIYGATYAGSEPLEKALRGLRKIKGVKIAQRAVEYETPSDQ